MHDNKHGEWAPPVSILFADNDLQVGSESFARSRETRGFLDYNQWESDFPISATQTTKSEFSYGLIATFDVPLVDVT
jgi:hypothetical protein